MPVCKDPMPVQREGVQNKVKHMFDGQELVHLTHPLMPKEYALCGDDITGDDQLGITPGVPTDESITCKRCITMVQVMRRILLDKKI